MHRGIVYARARLVQIPARVFVVLFHFSLSLSLVLGGSPVTLPRFSWYVCMPSGAADRAKSSNPRTRDSETWIPPVVQSWVQCVRVCSGFGSCFNNRRGLQRARLGQLNCQASLTFVHSYIEFSLIFFTVLILSFCHLSFLFSLKVYKYNSMTKNI